MDGPQRPFVEYIFITILWFYVYVHFFTKVMKLSGQDSHQIDTFGRLGPAFKIDETPADQLDPTTSYDPRIARA